MFSLNLEFDVQSATKHVPILVEEILENLRCEPDKNFLDLTLGGGGHSQEILRSTAPHGKLIACDRDESAIERAKERLSNYSDRVSFFHQNISEVDVVLEKTKSLRLHGALIDAGISSDQLDSETRGFSFLRNADLDMRMDTSKGMTAKEWLASAKEEDIANTIYEFGEERGSRRIAKSIVEARRQNKLNTTQDLVEAVEKAVGGRRGPIHPATKTFQALRIKVNHELDELSEGVKKLTSLLPAFARIAVITFHSLEDRIVKNVFRDAAKNGLVVRVTKKPIIPSREEQRSNPRSRSAKLRVVEIAGENDE